MTSEIRTNSIKSRAGLSTVTLTDSGPMFIGITTFNDGKVSIGANNPAAKLEIKGSENPLVKIVQDTSGIARLNLESETNDGYQYSGIGLGDGTNDAELMWTTLGFDINVGNSVRLRINSNGAWGAGTNFGSSGQVLTSQGSGSAPTWTTVSGTTINNNTDNYVITGTGTANTLRGESGVVITSDSELIVGMTAGSGATPDARLQVRGDNHTRSKIQVLATHNDDNPATLQISKSRSGGNTILGDNDDIGQINFAGNDGNGYHTVGRIMVSSSGEGNGDDDLPSVMRFFNTANGSVSLTERMRLNSNGSLSIANTRNYYGALNVEKTSTSSTAIDVKADGSGGSYAKAFTFGDHNTIQGSLSVLNSSDIFFRTDTNHSLTFGVNNTEKMRLNLHGFLKCMGDMSSHMSADGNNYHEMQADNPHIQILNMKHGSSNGYGIMMQFAHGKSTHWAFRVYNYASGSTNMFIRTDGDLENINNSYGSTSDVKLKENIVDAKSQWDDIKALRVRNFNYKADESKTKMLGLVAQEAEQVCPSLVKDQPDLGEENEDLGTTTKFMKYSIVYMKAIKALQEAQERIEKLEQENIALRIRVTNLEDN